MATLFDLGTLNFFVPLFVFILIFVVLYALFEKTKLFGEEKNIHALVAFTFSILFIIVKPLRDLVTTITPWFVIFFFLIFILIVAVLMVGFKESDITKYLSDNSGVATTGIVILIVIFLLGLRTVYPGSLGFPSGDSGNFEDLRRTFFNPRILGFFLVFVIAYFVMRAVGYSSKK